MALDFPSSPTNGQTYTSSGRTWTWNSSTSTWESTNLLTSSQITTALGYTPYNSTNPNGYTSNTGTVTSVGGTGTVSGLTLSGTVTSSGNLTLGGTLSVAASNFASQTANTVLAAPSGAAGSPTFRILTLEDLPDAWVKRSVTVATTANITLSGTQTIDGVAVAAGNRVLVKNQTTAAQNGIYVVAAGGWTRALDADTSSKIAGAVVNVDSGTTNGGKIFDTDFKSSDTLGTTAMSWYSFLDTSSTYAGTLTSSQVTTALGYTPYNSTNPNGYTSNTGTVTSITAGTGLSGGTISTSGTIALANTAVTAGSYTSANITVDAQGRITAASNGSGGYGAATLRNVTSGYTSGGQVFVTGTTPTASAAGDFWFDTSGTSGFTQALSSSGYTKLPNGFMMVWGTSSFLSQDSSAAQTFPYSFTNACFHVFLTVQGTINTGGGGSDSVSGISTTGFTLYHGSDPGRSFSYLAIGY